MTLPRPAHTALANYTDWYIRTLAYAIDAQLGQAVKIVTIAGVAATTDGNGVVWFNFPGLGQLAGAIVLPAGMVFTQGAIKEMPPIPPASIGRVIPATPVTFTQFSLNVGSAAFQVMNTPWDNGEYKGQLQQIGAQKAPAGLQVTGTGIAWGAAV